MGEDEPKTGTIAEGVRFSSDEMEHVPSLGGMSGGGYESQPREIEGIGETQISLMRFGKMAVRSLADEEVVIINDDNSVSKSTFGEAHAERYFQLGMNTDRTLPGNGVLTTRLSIDGEKTESFICSTEGRKSEAGINFLTGKWRNMDKGGKKTEIFVSGPNRLEGLEFGFMFTPHQGGDAQV